MRENVSEELYFLKNYFLKKEEVIISFNRGKNE